MEVTKLSKVSLSLFDLLVIFNGSLAGIDESLDASMNGGDILLTSVDVQVWYDREQLSINYKDKRNQTKSILKQKRKE